MPLFFSCSCMLESNSIVLPGNWLRIVRRYTPSNGNPWILARELIFEFVRQTEFPDKPSRWTSNFLCESSDALRAFVAGNKRFMDLLYEVEMLDEQLPQHRGCMQLQAIMQEDNYDSILEKAKRYWSAENIQQPEIITTSRIRIIRKLSM